MRKEIYVKSIEIEKSDFKDLDGYLTKEGFIDSRKLWFAGFDDQRRGSQNAMAANLFSGNQKLMIFTIKDDDVYYLQNSRKGLQVNILGKTSDKFTMVIPISLGKPSVEIGAFSVDRHFIVKVTKNKQVLKEFKKEIK